MLRSVAHVTAPRNGDLASRARVKRTLWNDQKPGRKTGLLIKALRQDAGSGPRNGSRVQFAAGKCSGTTSK
jgi:hypothetical protein